MSANKKKYLNAIELENVNFSYPKQKNIVLKNIDFTLPFGSSLTIFGTNGSGKTTLGKLMVGLLLHFQGKVKVLDQLLTEKNYRNVINEVGIVFQNADSQFIGEDVENDLVFGLENQNVSPDQMLVAVKKIATDLDIVDILNAQPVDLSAGKKQRVAIASVLITKPKIIIFDESTNMLDKKAKEKILTIIDRLKKQKDITVIEITHDTERILTSDFVLLLKDGKQTFFGQGKDLLLKHAHLFSQSSDLHFPFVYRLSQALKNSKVTDKIFLNQNELVNYLCKLKQ